MPETSRLAARRSLSGTSPAGPLGGPLRQVGRLVFPLTSWLVIMTIGAVVAGCGDVKQTIGADAGTDAGTGTDGGSLGDLPDTFFDRTPSELSNEATVQFEFSSDIRGATFECSVNGAPVIACVSPLELAVAEGEQYLEVAAIDAENQRDASPATFAWTVDLTPPVVTFIAAPEALDNSFEVTFAFSATEDAEFTCTLDGAAAASCTSPVTVTDLADGFHEFAVMAIDRAGNSASSAAVHKWTIDLSTPDARIGSGPAGDVNEDVATFTFSSPDAGELVFECSVDGAAFATCTSPFEVTGLDDGDHEFQVRARDETGNVDPTPASRIWTVDTVAPAATITGGPDGPTSETQPSFHFSTDGEPVTIQCRFDADPLTDCTSPIAPIAALSEGDHSFEVVVTDAAGNASSTTRDFTLDTMGPAVTVTGGPAGPTRETTATFTFTVGATATSVECKIGGDAYAACSETFTTGALSEGAHTFYVRARDAGDNETVQSRGFTVDVTAPTVVIDSPSTPSSDDRPDVTFAVTGGADFVECRTDTADFVSCTSPHTLAALSDGSHTFHVRAQDAAGNTTSRSVTFDVDTVAPTVTITTSLSATRDPSPSFSFTTGGTPAAVRCSFGSATSPGTYESCTSPHTSAAQLSDGDSHAFWVEATDAAGNKTTKTSASFTVDTVAPTISIDPPSDPTRDSTPALSFSTDGSPSSVACRIDAGAYAACTSPYTPVTLGEGTHTFYVKADDVAGNTTTRSATFNVDTAGPTVSITTALSATRDTTPSFGFTTGGAPTSVRCSFGSASAPGSYATCSSPYTSPSVLPDGTNHAFWVEATDASGNKTTRTSATFTVDTVAPTVAIATAQSPTGDSTPDFVFSTGGAPVSVRCKIGATGTYAPCTSPYTALQLSDGSHTFSVEAKDLAGNTATAEATVVVDSVAPVVTIDPLNVPFGTTTPALSFFATGADVSVECKIDTRLYESCGSPYTPAALSEGQHTFYVRAVDSAGNATTRSEPFTVDTSGPVVDITTTITVTNDNTPSFAFRVSGAPASVQCSYGTSAAPGAYAGCTSPYVSPTGLPDGITYAFWVEATDGAGNKTTKTSATFSVDTVAPTVTITPPSSPSSSTTPQFLFATNGAATLVRCKIGATGSYATCASPYTSPVALADGSHTFSVEATDAAGNSHVEEATVTVDATAPSVTIDQPVSPGNDNTPSLTFAVGGAPVTVECSIDFVDFAACSSPYTPSAVSEGQRTFYVRATDAAGNTTTASVTFIVDSIAPTVTIDTSFSLTNDNTPSFGFTVGGLAALLQCSFGTASAAGVFQDCSGSFTAPSALADGTGHVFWVKVADAVGNTTIEASTAFEVDTVAPVVTISRPSSPTADNTPTFSFTAPGASTVRCKIGGSGVYAGCTSPYTPSNGLPEGNNTLSVEAIDAAGNVHVATSTVSVDTKGPVLGWYPSPPPTTTTAPTTTVNFVRGADTVKTTCVLFFGWTVVTSTGTCQSGWEADFRAHGAGQYTIHVVVEDALANKTTLIHTLDHTLVVD